MAELHSKCHQTVLHSILAPILCLAGTQALPAHRHSCDAVLG